MKREDKDMTDAMTTNFFEGVEITGTDPRMRFRNSQDPVFVAFDYIDKQPLEKLAKSYLKDKYKEIVKFISEFGKDE